MIVLLVLSTVTTVYVLYIHYHGALKVALPKVAKTVILNWLANIVLMRDKVELVLSPDDEEEPEPVIL